MRGARSARGRLCTSPQFAQMCTLMPLDERSGRVDGSRASLRHSSQHSAFEDVQNDPVTIFGHRSVNNLLRTPRATNTQNGRACDPQSLRIARAAFRPAICLGPVDVVRSGEHRGMLVAITKVKKAVKLAHRVRLARKSSQTYEQALPWRSVQRLQDHAIDFGPVPGDARELVEAGEGTSNGIVLARQRPPIFFFGRRRRNPSRIVDDGPQDRHGTVVVAFVGGAYGNQGAATLRPSRTRWTNFCLRQKLGKFRISQESLFEESPQCSISRNGPRRHGFGRARVLPRRVDQAMVRRTAKGLNDMHHVFVMHLDALP